MALSAKYKDFLASPQETFLAEGASLNYVPTTTSLSQPAIILKHLQAQQQLVEKTNEKFLNIIESADSLCIETETTLHFVAGGGTYLPGLDDNFLIDRNVVLPIIRLLWDQACLLKAVETIGARGRGWPVRDGKDQIKMIASSSAAAPSAAGPEVEERLSRRFSRGTDPHSSLNLFAPREANARGESPLKHNVAPRPSAKPAQRDMTELFAAGSTDPNLASPERSPSPNKRDRENSNPTKAGAGKHYQASRLFEEDPSTATPEKGIKTYKNKYNHFEFGDPIEEQKKPITSRFGNKHLSQWDFGDFATPEKPKVRSPIKESQCTFPWDSGTEGDKTPTYSQHVPQARPTSSAHFSYEDTTPPNEKTRPSTSTSSRSGLYEDHIFGGQDNDTGLSTAGKVPPSHTSTYGTAQHNETFSTHWELSDASPEAKNQMAAQHNQSNAESLRNKPEIRARDGRSFQANAEPGQTQPRHPTLAEEQQHNKTFAPHWELSDASPDFSSTSTSGDQTKWPLRNITNANTQAHNSTFTSHWELSDVSPETKTKMAGDENRGEQERVAKKPEARAQANSAMTSSWSLGDNESVPDVIRGSRGKGPVQKAGERHWWDFEA